MRSDYIRSVVFPATAIKYVAAIGSDREVPVHVTLKLNTFSGEIDKIEVEEYTVLPYKGEDDEDYDV